MATPIVSRRGTVAGVDFYLASFTWQDERDSYCQVDFGISLAQLVDRAEAWLASGRECPGVEIWLGKRVCVFLRDSAGTGPDDVQGLWFPQAPGIYRWDSAQEAYVPMKRRVRRALVLAEGSGPA
jgi:hypothetical protein